MDSHRTRRASSLVRRMNMEYPTAEDCCMMIPVIWCSIIKRTRLYLHSKTGTIPTLITASTWNSSKWKVSPTTKGLAYQYKSKPNTPCSPSRCTGASSTLSICFSNRTHIRKDLGCSTQTTINTSSFITVSNMIILESQTTNMSRKKPREDSLESGSSPNR